MAEFIMKDKINKLGLSNKFIITSRATSYEEEGNDMHRGAKNILQEKGISYTPHQAKRLEKEDYNKFDYFICMDRSNIRNINYIFEDSNNKVFKLLDKDIADPWYTGNFIDTYNDLNEGIDLLISKLL
jgi:protein-tyrosine phosphatase